LLLAILALQSGCSLSEPKKPPFKTLSRPITGISRVVFVELAERNSYPGIAGDMTTALSHAIKGRGLFGLDVVDRLDPLCQDLPTLGRGGITLQQISQMHKTFQCDGILLGSIHDFRPHPRMQLGVSLRLLDLKRGRILWAVDHVWDTTDKSVEKRVQDFFSDQMRSGYGPMDWRIAMISPKVFEKFIAFELAETLHDPTEVASAASANRNRKSALDRQREMDKKTSKTSKVVEICIDN